MQDHPHGAAQRKKDPLCQLLRSTGGKETSKLEPAECVEKLRLAKTNLPVQGRPNRGEKIETQQKCVTGTHIFFVVCCILLSPVNSEIVEPSCKIHSDQTVQM